MPVSGSTPTAAEVSMLQAAAFQAALDHQQARQHTPLAVTAPTSAAVALTPAAVPLAPAAVVLAPAAVAPMPAAASHAAANSGVTAVALSLANQERFCCQQCASEAPPPSCVTAVEQQPLLMSTVFSDQQTLSPSHSQSSPVVPVGLAALSDLDGIDLEIECDGQAPNSALLLPVAPADSAHSRLLPHTARLPLGVSYLTARAAGTSDEQSAGCEESGSVLSRPQMHIPSDTQAHIFPDAQMHIPPDTALAEDAAPLLTDREHDATTNPTSAAEAGIASAQSADRRQQQQPGGNPQIGSSVRSAMRDTLTLESPEQHWYQHGSLAASTAASDSSHDTPRDATDSKLPASASAAKHAADGDVLECCRSLGSPALSLHPLGHFHMAPSELPSLASGTVAGNPAPIEQPSTAAMAAQDQEADNGAVKGMHHMCHNDMHGQHFFWDCMLTIHLSINQKTQHGQSISRGV